ncbi:hypothetical protein VNO80_10642 [Phaseolus coccineus]|uniref:Uncharacterized protein n=1 Tax=Phaseolus coccineus TaxID=3886 RepID=A0AAN9RET4_PHACN
MLISCVEFVKDDESCRLAPLASWLKVPGQPVNSVINKGRYCSNTRSGSVNLVSLANNGSTAFLTLAKIKLSGVQSLKKLD